MNITKQGAVTKRVRLDYIDALRGIAAVMVLVCHCTQIDSTLKLPEHVIAIFESFKYGVQLFFVISAFTIFYSLYSSDSGTYNFFIRRFFRIAPLYFVAIAFYAYVYGSTTSGIALNATFLHGFSPRYINSVVPGGWSIGVEMAFYCLVPFLFRFITNLRTAVYFFIVTAVLSFLLFYGYRKLVVSTGAAESFVYFWLPNQLPVFAIGFMVYFATFQSAQIRMKELFYPVIALVLLALFTLVTDFSIFGKHLLFGAASGLGIYMLKFKPFPFLVNRITLLLGKISYSLYLSNYAAIYLLQKTGFCSFLPSKTGIYLYTNILINFLLLFAITTGLAYMLYHAIELPFQRLGRKLLKRKNTTLEVKPALTMTRIQNMSGSQEINI